MESVATRERSDRLTVSSRHQTDAIDITELVQQRVTEAGISDGLCTVYVAHTTAGVFINENADRMCCTTC